MPAVDSTGGFLVNDLAFRSYVQDIMERLDDNVEGTEKAKLDALMSAERVYLRIGLARPEQLGDYPVTCWAQVTGVYTFPDYLGGRTFADFA